MKVDLVKDGAAKRLMAVLHNDEERNMAVVINSFHPPLPKYHKLNYD